MLLQFTCAASYLILSGLWMSLDYKCVVVVVFSPTADRTMSHYWLLRDFVTL